MARLLSPPEFLGKTVLAANETPAKKMQSDLVKTWKSLAEQQVIISDFCRYVNSAPRRSHMQYVTNRKRPYGWEFKMKSRKKWWLQLGTTPSLGATLDTYGYLGIAGCTVPLLPGGPMDAARIAWETPLPSPSRPFSFLLSLPTLPSPNLLSPLVAPSGMCLSLPFAVLLQLSRCCVFIIFCRFSFALLPTFPPCSSFVLPACCVLPLPVVRLCLFFLLFPRCFVVAGCPYLPSSFPLSCVCVKEHLAVVFIVHVPDFLVILDRWDSCILTTGIKTYHQIGPIIPPTELTFQRSFTFCRDAM